MSIIKISSLTFATLIIVACHSSKKSKGTTSTAATTTNAVTTQSTSIGPSLPAKSTDGIYEPGNEELVAIQTQYKDATLDKLKEGHSIYTVGACVKCHNPKNIYRREESHWKGIIDDMATRANISETQKDAVYKYVMSIKATQPK